MLLSLLEPRGSANAVVVTLVAQLADGPPGTQSQWLRMMAKHPMECVKQCTLDLNQAAALRKSCRARGEGRLLVGSSVCVCVCVCFVLLMHMPSWLAIEQQRDRLGWLAGVGLPVA
jgi:hypothetical protein